VTGYSMNIKIPEEQKNLQPLTGNKFYVIGPRRIQNELIASHLEKEIGNECLLLENFNQIPKENPKPGAHPSLVLWDCVEKELERFLADIETNTGQKKSAHRIVFFNVSNGMEFRKKYALKGIYGFFYEHDPMDIFIKGVQAVLDGKLWFSREVMSQYIFKDTDKDKSSKNIRVELTKRQTEILSLIAVGATNDEIADKLCISPYTVKTHLYKIFKKINVPNRVQASLWAAKNL
jgi:LuxR family transcriptional regulator of csgAB operon